ncbi:zinc ABC transporter permease [Candidatus Rickettsiella isopodorum]|jgi:zinc/manganese transport system ATP-binding protein|uniref:Zinc ABC transporter permease n=1 Tax=Candidatus Rickettsiella isopodorum TaxID=1225476 RepID=A0A1J8PE16_9COXI|nr:ABC transporter ATP-binding protein [Candidatus Rickettsiella isopodorum]OIZ95591.1 zinc ABC transporter permease [Candidatus Rickettsiella isopodorum]
MNAIEFKQFSLAYGQRCIFQNFTADIKSGEFVAILGANGAGKSTLLRSILGLIAPSKGGISLFGQAVHKGAAFIGYMPQMRQNSGNSLSAYAWLGANLNGYQWGLPVLNSEQTEELQRVIQLVKAEKIVNRPYNLLSGGERQRLLLAQALLNKPKILLLDEPLMNLDPYYQATLVSLIDDIRLQHGITILFTSHDINPLLTSVDRVLYLAKGKAVIGLVNEIINSKKLSELYGLDIQVIQHEQQLFVINKELGFHHHVNHCRPDLDHFAV